MSFDWAISLAASFANTLVPALLAVGLVSAVLRWVLNLNGATRYAVWLFAFALVIGWPLVSLIELTSQPSEAVSVSQFVNEQPPTTPVFDPPASRSQLPAAQPLNDVTIGEPAQIHTAGNPSPVASSNTRPNWLLNKAVLVSGFAIWVLGALAFLCRLLASAHQLIALRRHTTDAPHSLNTQLRQWRAKLNVPSGVLLRLSSQVAVPMTTGLFRPTIILPSSAPAISQETMLDHALLHELQHINRKDHWVKPIQQIIGALFWWHPVLWWINRKLNLEREIACDEAVLAHAGTKPNQYAKSLVCWAERALQRQSPAFTTSFIVRSQLEKRLTAMLNKNSFKCHKTSIAYPLLFTGVVGVFLLFLTPMFPAIGIAEQTSKLYWVANHSIQSMNLDGSQLETIVDSRKTPVESKVHFGTNMTYWISRDGTSILRMALTGGDIETVVNGATIQDFELTLNGQTLFYVMSNVDWANERTTYQLYKLNISSGDQDLLLEFELGFQPKTEITGAIISSQFGVEGDIELAFDEAHQKLYWFAPRRSIVYRSNTDGTQQEQLEWPSQFSSHTIFRALDIDQVYFVDEGQPRMYWYERIQGRVHRINLDGSEYQMILHSMQAQSNPVFDFAKRSIYWISKAQLDENPVLRKASLDVSASQIGTIEPVLIDFGNVTLPISIASSDEFAITNLVFDQSESELYWAIQGLENRFSPMHILDKRFNEKKPTVAAIQRANLDGSQIETIVDGLEGQVAHLILKTEETPLIGFNPGIASKATIPSDADKALSTESQLTTTESAASFASTIDVESGAWIEFRIPQNQIKTFRIEKTLTEVIGKGFKLTLSEQTRPYHIETDLASQTLVVAASLHEKEMRFQNTTVQIVTTAANSNRESRTTHLVRSGLKLDKIHFEGSFDANVVELYSDGSPEVTTLEAFLERNLTLSDRLVVTPNNPIGFPHSLM